MKFRPAQQGSGDLAGTLLPEQVAAALHPVVTIQHNNHCLTLRFEEVCVMIESLRRAHLVPPELDLGNEVLLQPFNGAVTRRKLSIIIDVRLFGLCHLRLRKNIENSIQK